MIEKKYVVITKAMREALSFITSTTSDLDPSSVPNNYIMKEHYAKAVSVPLEYRKGDLGLVHSEIVKFFNDYEAREERARKSGRNLTTYIPISWSGLWCDLYTHEKGDVPVLIYGGDLLTGGPLIDEKRSYFIAMFGQGEFEEIKGTDLKSVKRGVREIHAANNMDFDVSMGNLGVDGTFNHVIEDQWRHLLAYDALLSGRVEEIPVESARRKIPAEKLLEELKLHNRLHNTGPYRPKPLTREQEIKRRMPYAA